MPYEVPNDVIMYHEKRIELNILIYACIPYTFWLSSLRRGVIEPPRCSLDRSLWPEAPGTARLMGSSGLRLWLSSHTSDLMLVNTLPNCSCLAPINSEIKPSFSLPQLRTHFPSAHQSAMPYVCFTGHTRVTSHRYLGARTPYLIFRLTEIIAF